MLERMAKVSRKPKKHSTEPVELPQMPFDDALRAILKAPPQHKSNKGTKKKK
jgi:hypothetical protein